MSEVDEECVTGLNTLIEEGGHKAVEIFITENEIKPDDYYAFLKSLGRGLGPVGLAAKCGKVNVMKSLLNMGFSLTENFEKSPAIFPIHMACRGGSIEAVKVLMDEYGVDVTDAMYTAVSCPICQAAGYGSLALLQYFRERGISVERALCHNGISPLYGAAFKNQVKICSFLLSIGADVNIADGDKRTPLMFAAWSKSYDSARVLVEAGANTNLADKNGATALLYAVENNDLKMMKLFVSYGADPEIEDIISRSALVIALEQNRMDIVYYLVNELNVPLYPPSHFTGLFDRTACSIALFKNNYGLVIHLAQAGYDPADELKEYVNGLNDYRKPEESLLSTQEFQELRDMLRRPKSLMSLCALTVRGILGRRLPVDLGSLPVPEIIQQLIVACGRKK